VTRSGDGVGAPAGERADELELEVEALREDLGDLVGELGQRRHNALDLRRQVRRHPVVVTVAAVIGLGLLGGGIALAVRRQRRQRSLAGRAARLARALLGVAHHPERLEREALMLGLGRKIATAGGTAAASALARRLFSGKS
jgi:hypothetical protein